MSFFKKRVREAMSSPEYAKAYAGAKDEAMAGADEMEGFDNGFVIFTIMSNVTVNAIQVAQASSEPSALGVSSWPLTSALPTLQAEPLAIV